MITYEKMDEICDCCFADSRGRFVVLFMRKSLKLSTVLLLDPLTLKTVDTLTLKGKFEGRVLRTFEIPKKEVEEEDGDGDVTLGFVPTTSEVF